MQISGYARTLTSHNASKNANHKIVSQRRGICYQETHRSRVHLDNAWKWV